MNKLEEFRFLWKDAWGHIDYGIDTIIERCADGMVYLCMIVNGKPRKVIINEEKFIKDLESIRIWKWNMFEYVQWMEDGAGWELSITYGNTHIESSGRNGYPPRFLEFLQILHKHGVPEIAYEKQVTTKEIGRSKKRTKEKNTVHTYRDVENNDYYFLCDRG